VLEAALQGAVSLAATTLTSEVIVHHREPQISVQP
jgi:hypothetical protein